MDEDSSHTAAESQEVAAALDIAWLWQPKRSLHLNPMDPLWRHSKAVMFANHQDDSIDVHVEQFIDYLAGLSPHDTLQKAGVLSPDFWLKM